MKKQLFYAPLWGIFALSLLSCRTEDNFTQQNNQQDKRFAVFVPKKGKQINYADGFTYLMKKSDKLHKTNLSGINNQPVIGNFNAGTEKKASVVQNAASYVEFNVRSQTITEENGDKWLIYAKVQGNKVVGLIAAILSNKETYVAYKEIDQQHVLYTQNIFRFQLALDKYQKHKILSSAKAVTPPPGGSDGDSGCGADVEQCGNIEEVIITKPKQTGVFYIDVWLGRTPGEGGGGCGFYDNCSFGDGSGGGGGEEDEPVDDKIDVEELKDYPCAYALARQLPNLGDSFSNLIKITFAENERIKVTFVPKDFENRNLEGHFIEDKEKTQTTGVIHFNIEISQNVLKNSTQEYVLSVMYHEFVHAYLGYEFIKLGPDAYHTKYPYLESYTIDGVQKFRFISGDHQAFSPFINMIADGIQAYNPSFPRKLAIGLAMGGLAKETDEGVGARQNERESNKHASGTKCSKP